MGRERGAGAGVSYEHIICKSIVAWNELKHGERGNGMWAEIRDAAEKQGGGYFPKSRVALDYGWLP